MVEGMLAAGWVIDCGSECGFRTLQVSIHVRQLIASGLLTAWLFIEFRRRSLRAFSLDITFTSQVICSSLGLGIDLDCGSDQQSFDKNATALPLVDEARRCHELSCGSIRANVRLEIGPTSFAFSSAPRYVGTRDSQVLTEVSVEQPLFILDQPTASRVLSDAVGDVFLWL
ncbi:hypothetical protein Efla_004443 [Eimeria flavescens]